MNDKFNRFISKGANKYCESHNIDAPSLTSVSTIYVLLDWLARTDPETLGIPASERKAIKVKHGEGGVVPGFLRVYGTVYSDFAVNFDYPLGWVTEDFPKDIDEAWTYVYLAVPGLDSIYDHVAIT